MKPIIFNTEMVRAILSGKKTCSRRVVKQQYAIDIEGGKHPFSSVENHRCSAYFAHADNPNIRTWIAYPYCPGDILYVRETWAIWSPTFGTMPTFHYKADGEDLAGVKWKPSIHMPKEAARIFLRVKSVRAERMQKSFFEPISPIFAVQSEGIDIGETCRVCIDAYGHPCCVDEMDDDGTANGECGMLDDARDEFADLWDSTIKPADLLRYGWSANPWVWVIEFEKLDSDAQIPCD